MAILLFILGIVFTILKLTAVIAWSWWWVVSPFILLAILIVFAVFIAATIAGSVVRRYW